MRPQSQFGGVDSRTNRMILFGRWETRQPAGHFESLLSRRTKRHASLAWSADRSTVASVRSVSASTVPVASQGGQALTRSLAVQIMPSLPVFATMPQWQQMRWSHHFLIIASSLPHYCLSNDFSTFREAKPGATASSHDQTCFSRHKAQAMSEQSRLTARGTG